MILLDNRQEKIEVDEKIASIIEDITEHTLEIEEVNEKIELSVIFVDNVDIMKINNEHRNINKETDVLSFPMLEYPRHKVYKEVYKNHSFDASYYDADKLVLGDIVLSLEKAKEQSIEYGHSFNREICYLLVHSLLHLLGYDHMEEEDKKNMRTKEEEILNRFQIIR